MANHTMPEKPSALLLLGPTGAGKTPLGELLEDRGICGRRCVHFDFGANLRNIVARNQPNEWISQSEIDFLRSVLKTGVLLEDQHFPIAARILQGFLQQQSVGNEDWVILNGLPRHVGQAEAIEAMVAVQCVVCLACSDATVYRRIQLNTGGDRTDRVDDDFSAVCQKLSIYRDRTAPLLAHYRQRGIVVPNVEVLAETTAEAVWQRFAFFPIDW